MRACSSCAAGIDVLQLLRGDTSSRDRVEVSGPRNRHHVGSCEGLLVVVTLDHSNADRGIDVLVKVLLIHEAGRHVLSRPGEAGVAVPVDVAALIHTSG